ncbi:uncharacterized protein LOC134209605 [Armigeres subalbatus]|uniref:uncharacterized protein LOC134209605 n=1 Tax=Armigeres subalbatus TaxID=124917 RepID=UPI002ECFB321
MKRYNDSKQLKRRQVQALFKLPKLAKESATELRSLLEGFERSMQTLDQLVQPVEYKDLLLLDVLCARLDPITRRSWEELSSTKEQDTIKDLTDFLQRRVKVLAALPTKSSSYKEEPPQQKRAPFRHLSYTTVQRERWGYVACQEDHPLYQCPRFQRMSIPDRTKVLRDNGLCRNCFRHGHWAVDCLSPYTCRNCRGKYHTLVCSLTPSNGSRNGSPTLRAPAASRSTHSERPTTQGGTPAQVSSNVTGTKVSSILLATAVILVEGNNGVRVPARALLDSGSECNFMTEKLAQQLKVQRQRAVVEVCGIGQANMKVTSTIWSRVTGFSRRLEFLLLPKVTANLPTTNVDVTGWEFPEGLKLADPTFFRSEAIDLVLGINNFFLILQYRK